jgi:hypothetical protein
MADHFPCLNNAADKDCGPDIRSCKLKMGGLAGHFSRPSAGKLTLHSITDMKPIPPMAPTVPVFFTHCQS